MKLHIAWLSVALAATMLAPVAAEAHEVSSSQSVRVHARAADGALVQFESAVKADAGAKAAKALARNRRHMRAASRELRRVRRSARGVRGASRASKATVAVALQADSSSGALADLVGEVDGRLKADVAGALNADLLTGAQALELLTGMVGTLPATLQTAVVPAIGNLTQPEQVVADIVGTLSTEALTAAVQQSLTSSLGIALATLDAGIEQLNGLVGVVSGTALPLVQSALAAATQQLQGLTQTLPGLPALPGLPVLGAGSGSIEIGLDGSQSVPVSGLCGLVGTLPFGLTGC